jgi:hypothetical protein
MLGPYTNMLDGIPAPEATDLTAFAPRSPELEPANYEPEGVDHLLPWLRNAAVTRVLSLDPLRHAELLPLGTVAPGPPGLLVHLYAVESAWPRTHVACRVIEERDTERALLRPYSPGFDPQRDVVLEPGRASVVDGPLAATCTRGRARLTAESSGEERVEVEANASGYLVVRGSYARGWRARVDGVPAPVLRANGKHRAVAIPAGKHEVVLRYVAPGFAAGVAVSLVSLVAAALLWRAAGREARG